MQDGFVPSPGSGSSNTDDTASPMGGSGTPSSLIVDQARTQNEVARRLQATQQQLRQIYKKSDRQRTAHEREKLALLEEYAQTLQGFQGTVNDASSLEELASAINALDASFSSAESRLASTDYRYTQLLPLQEALTDLLQQGVVTQTPDGAFAVTDSASTEAQRLVQAHNQARKQYSRLETSAAKDRTKLTKQLQAVQVWSNIPKTSFIEAKPKTGAVQPLKPLARKIVQNTISERTGPESPHSAEDTPEAPSPSEAQTIKGVREALQEQNAAVHEDPIAAQTTEEQNATQTEANTDSKTASSEASPQEENDTAGEVEPSTVQSAPIQPITPPVPPQTSHEESATVELEKDDFEDPQTAQEITRLQASLKDAQQTPSPVSIPSSSVAAAPAPTAINASPSTIEAARLAAAIQAAVGAPPASVIQNTTAPAVTSSIEGARANLRVEHQQQQARQEIINAYQERLRTRTYSYLQEHTPEQAKLYARIEQETHTRLDVFGTLTPEQQQRVHLQALVDIKGSFPDLSQEAVSRALLTATDVALDGLQDQATIATLGQAIATLGVAQQERALTTAAGVVANALGQAREATQALQSFEANNSAQKQRVTVLAAITPSGLTDPQRVELETIRSEQQQAPLKRQALQAKAAQHLSHVSALQRLSEANGTLHAAQSTAALGWLQGFFATHSPGANQPTSTDTSPSTRGGVTPTNVNNPSVYDQNISATSTDAQKAAAYFASRIQSQRQRPMTTLSSNNRTSSTAMQNAGSHTEADPLLAIAAKPATDRARFSAQQKAMMATTASLVGTSTAASGYEASLGQTSIIAAQDDGIPRLDSDLLEELSPDEVAEQEALYTQQLAEDRAREEHAQKVKDAEHETSMQQRVEQAKNASKLARNPAVRKLGGRLLTSLGSIPVVGWIVLVLIVTVWLNIRLFFSKEGSGWREPMGLLLSVATIGLDLIVMVLLYLLILITIGPIMLPLIALRSLISGH